MKKLSLMIILVLIIREQGYGQSDTPIFIGIQPNITVEPFYDEGEFDLDIVPIVFEASVGLRTNINVSSEFK
ncbi:hypothetical protein WJR50_12960 [Catalinimonas sp. 4WD22]|uniref:hypothetical protein n=1 Tax=Catalinimonas locisalis TaxID=3133978 RepID=UPI00310196D9